MADAKMIESDYQLKLATIRRFLVENNLQGILLTSQASFSWLTTGRGHIGLNSDQACGKLFISQAGVYLVTNNIEAERIIQEEVKSLSLDLRVYTWYEANAEKEICNQIVDQGNWLVETDSSIAQQFAKLRWDLTPADIKNYRKSAQAVASALEQTCLQTRQGESELEIAARLVANCVKVGVDPVLQLVAVDERAELYRHPLPTNKCLKQFAMVVVGGRKYGLTVSATRLVHFGQVPQELKMKHEAVALLDAEIIARTRPGANAGEIFRYLQKRYDQLGYPSEWMYHHQGGLTGFLSREYKATEQTNEVVRVNQAFAWNPSIRGTKSEDTILVGPMENEILTETGNWPLLDFEIENSVVRRPAILQL